MDLEKQKEHAGRYLSEMGSMVLSVINAGGHLAEVRSQMTDKEFTEWISQHIGRGHVPMARKSLRAHEVVTQANLTAAAMPPQVFLGLLDEGLPTDKVAQIISTGRVASINGEGAEVSVDELTRGDMAALKKELQESMSNQSHMLQTISVLEEDRKYLESRILELETASCAAAKEKPLSSLEKERLEELIRERDKKIAELKSRQGEIVAGRLARKLTKFFSDDDVTLVRTDFICLPKKKLDEIREALMQMATELDEFKRRIG